jgi:hypothetical protein
MYQEDVAGFPCGSRTRSFRNTWKLAKNANHSFYSIHTGPETPGIGPSNICFNKFPRRFWCTLQLGNHWPKIHNLEEFRQQLWALVTSCKVFWYLYDLNIWIINRSIDWIHLPNFENWYTRKGRKRSRGEGQRGHPFIKLKLVKVAVLFVMIYGLDACDIPN